ncbi:hypothetical protein QWJ46_18370 [Rhizobium sp. CBN3]|nr:hypothetical protein [Rhizobium sp. CBN3]MDO3434643.1 hypothetical protein [Rhizobium sp. CBN3]
MGASKAPFAEAESTGCELRDCLPNGDIADFRDEPVSSWNDASPARY